MTALTVEGLAVRFGSQEALRGLSFTVPAGGSLAIVGPNGAGKTVLFRALIGAIPYEGTVRWAPDTRLGYAPQRLDIARDLPITGRDFMRAKASVAKVSTGTIAAVLSRVDLGASVLDKLIGTMSGGQFQRLLIACALVGDPNVLLLDEPTAGVDEPRQQSVNDMIRALNEAGMTILMISHDLSVVYRYATSVLCLSQQHPCFGVPRDILTPENLPAVYGTPVGFHVHDRNRR